MSNLQHRAMHHDGLYSTAAIHAGHHHHQHHHAMHPPHTQSTMMDHCVTTCPYEDKIIQNGAVARMVLMFIRELVEHSSHQPRQSYACPMTRCHRPFAGPLQLIQHLLSCPEVSTGEFTCDKCNHWHTFPTNDKDWEQWAAMKSQQSLGNEQGHVRRKRSLGSKIKGFATLTKRDARKQNPAPDAHFKTEYSMDSRPSTAASSTPSTIFTRRCSEHHTGYPGHDHGNTTTFDLQKPPLLPAGVPGIDGNGLFWPGFSADQLGNIPSSVPSIAPSSTLDTSSSKPISQNTSQTTLFTPSLNGFQPGVTSAQVPTTMAQQQQYVFSTHPPFNGGTSPLPGQPPSAMVLDEPMTLNQADLTPTDLRSPVSTESLNHGWWGNKLGIETSRPPPPTSGPGNCFQMQSPIAAIDGMMTRDVTSGLTTPTSPCRHASPFFQMPPSSGHPMSRALSHESMQAGMTPVYSSPGANASHVDPLSPQTEHDPHSLALHQRTPFEPAPEDLICDECQWKPRGVRENLKGYLRKHKNTHKGLRLSCDVVGCTKTFSRLDNLKKHKKDKHGIEDLATNGTTCAQPPPKRMVEEYHAQHQHVEDGAEHKRPGTVDSEIRDMSGDYSMLWPALHF
ncbi:hypothetical protein B0T21DRAFT_414971 [Apiosordaria backusii]|uniref:C2H2-type domain-containing protein n=1 Tax=Apiosordaria backusii TaxID=314023 RepID=A0AA40AN71_9PEZI|nr:hypothetical protein B0T21DRAFT_414971 [Apiosordaria backusii]